MSSTETIASDRKPISRARRIAGALVLLAVWYGMAYSASVGSKLIFSGSWVEVPVYRDADAVLEDPRTSPLARFFAPIHWVDRNVVRWRHWNSDWN